MGGVQASLHYLTPLQKTEKCLSILTSSKHHMLSLFPSLSVFINLVSNHQCPRMEIISQINSGGQLHFFNTEKILLTFDVNSPSILCRLFSSVAPVCVLYQITIWLSDLGDTVCNFNASFHASICRFFQATLFSFNHIVFQNFEKTLTECILHVVNST